MTVSQVISTQGLAWEKRVEYWNAAACEWLNPMTVAPLDPARFSGQMRGAYLGDIRAIEVSCRPARVDRSQADVARCGEPVFLIDVQLRGCSALIQAGREALLSPGDFAISDSTRPHQVVFASPVSMLLLRVPSAVLRRYVRFAEDLVGIRIDGSRAYGAIVSRFLRDLWQNQEQVAGGQVALRTIGAALQLVGCSYIGLGGEEVKRESLADLYRLQAHDYIESHLGDPELTPTVVAEALRITPRYLHMLFTSEEETVARSIMRRRLDRCGRVLSDPIQQGRRITDIAFEHGFGSLGHFCQAFRQHFGMSPGDFRENSRQSAQP